MDIPKALSPDAESCLCPDCLIRKIAQGVNDETLPLTPALRKEIIGLGKPAQLVENVDYYMEGKFLVMTKWYHLRKGYCCKNNCRHCAYRSV